MICLTSTCFSYIVYFFFLLKIFQISKRPPALRAPPWGTSTVPVSPTGKSNGPHTLHTTCNSETRSRSNENAFEEYFLEAYLGSDLVATLACLDVHDFPHFAAETCLRGCRAASGWRREGWQRRKRGGGGGGTSSSPEVEEEEAAATAGAGGGEPAGRPAAGQKILPIPGFPLLQPHHALQLYCSGAAGRIVIG